MHLSAENCKFLQIADELEIMKPTRSGVMKNFNISCLDDFFVDDNMAIDNVLTLADRQIVINHALDSIRATPLEKYVPGYEHMTLYHGQSLVDALQMEGLIENIYSLRDTVMASSFATHFDFVIDFHCICFTGIFEETETLVYKMVRLATT